MTSLISRFKEFSSYDSAATALLSENGLNPKEIRLAHSLCLLFEPESDEKWEILDQIFSQAIAVAYFTKGE